MEVPLAYYNRFGHFAHANIVETGDFFIAEEIEIPNILTGKYLVTIRIVNPRVAILLNLDNAFVINAKGIISILKQSFLYDDVGFIKIEG